MDVSNRRIVILGKTGAGKSSLANTIFGEKVFKIDHTVSSGTSECEAKTKSVNGRSITLIDCPGFFDTDRSEEKLKREILRCITECAPGPHAFLIVLKVERFTEQEQAVINKINEYFSEEAFKYATVVFTHGDQLLEGQTIEDFVHQNKLLSDLMTKCGGRCHVIDNKYWNQKPKEDYRSNQFQVEELLKTIDKMVMENHGSCYTNEMLQAVENIIKQEEEKIRHQKLSGNMSEKEIREQAKANAFTKLSARLAGVGTGALLGALYGGAVMGALFLGVPIIGAAAAVGGVLGGVRGYYASEGADTPWEAVKTAAGTVQNDAERAFQGANVLEKRFQPRTQESEMSNRRIVILGKTGVGKSSLANTIFGEKIFKIDDSANSGTRKCEAKTKSVNGRSITLIDTPGFFDTDRSKDELKTEIVSCITECAPGPHAFLIVLEVHKFTEQEQAVINKINEYFSEEAFKYATVVFTHGDKLPEGQKIEDFVRQNKLLSDLVKKCGGRCHVIDNRYWKKRPKCKYRSNQLQVDELLKTIDKMVTENNGRCYTNEMLQAVEEEIEQEEENIRQLPGNMSEEEIREQATVNVSTTLSVRLAGVATGVLVGAFCGVVVSVGIVLAAVTVGAAAAAKVAARGGGAAAAAEEAARAVAAAAKVAAGGGRAAVRGGAAAAEGGRAAVRGGAAAAGGTVAAVIGTSAAVGAVCGGVRGYYACEGADTAGEAAKIVAKTVMNDVECVLDKANDLLKKIF